MTSSIRLTREQSRAVDKIAAEKYRMPTIILMENAARAVTDKAIQIIGKQTKNRILILCGPGNNGGDGLAAARHLHNRGVDVQILLLADSAKYKGDALINWQIIQAMQIRTEPIRPELITNASLIIDALFGTGLTEAPRAPFPKIAGAINQSQIPVLAVDIPSGLDCDTGLPLGPVALRAHHTVTFVAEKIGFAKLEAKQYVGQLSITDIGCPRECVEGMNH